MTISYSAVGSVGDNATSASVGYPSGIAAGDLLVLTATAKYSAYTSAPPSGFTLHSIERVGGSGGTGIDAGDVRTAVWLKVADGTESGSVSVTKATQTGSVILAQMLLYKRTAGYGWSIQSTSGTSSSGTTAWSAAGSNDIYIAAGDVVLCVTGANVNPCTFSSHSLTAAGCTFDTAAERIDTGTNTGHDISLLVTEHACTAGPSSAAPTFASTGSTGTPDGSTIFIRIREALGVAADQGDFDLTGQGAGLLKHTIMSAGQGSYDLTGQDASLSAGAPRAWAVGAWGTLAWYGTSWYGQGAVSYPLAVDQGSYDLTGYDVTFKAERLLTAEQGTLELTGQDAGLAKGYKLTAEQGSYTLTPQEFASSRTYQLAADQGTLTLTGQDAVFQSGATVGRAWTTGAWYEGAWYGTVWADNAGAPNHYLMPAAVGTYTVGAATQTAAWSDGSWADDAWYGTSWQGGGGSQTSLLVGYRLDAEQGSYTYTGDDALRDILMNAGAGTYALSGQDVAGGAGKSMTAEVGGYNLTGRSAGGLRGYRMSAGFGAYLTIGYEADFPLGIGAALDSGSFTLTGQDASLLVGRKLTAESGSYVQTGIDARLVPGAFFAADGDTFVLSGQDAGLRADRRLSASTGYYVTGGQLETPEPVRERRGGAGGAIAFMKRRAEVVVNGKVHEVDSEEEAKRLIDAAVKSAKRVVNAAAKKVKPAEIPLPDDVEVRSDEAELKALADEANRKIAEAFEKAVERAAEEEELALLL